MRRSDIQNFSFLLAGFLIAGTIVGALALHAGESTALDEREADGTVILRFTGIEEMKGVVRYALWDSEEEWLSGKPVRGGAVEVNAQTLEVLLKGIRVGTYAVSAFHDVNDNNDFDQGRFKIPKEPYGFSKDSRRRFGPAKWEDAHFAVNADEQTFEIVRK